VDRIVSVHVCRRYSGGRIAFGRRSCVGIVLNHVYSVDMADDERSDAGGSGGETRTEHVGEMSEGRSADYIGYHPVNEVGAPDMGGLPPAEPQMSAEPAESSPSDSGASSTSAEE
jgi:hypothetical protein